jgi:hypothetical protein
MPPRRQKATPAAAAAPWQYRTSRAGQDLQHWRVSTASQEIPMSQLSTPAREHQAAERDHALTVTVLTAALALGFGLLLAAQRPVEQDEPPRATAPAAPAEAAAAPEGGQPLARLAGDAPLEDRAGAF